MQNCSNFSPMVWNLYPRGLASFGSSRLRFLSAVRLKGWTMVTPCGRVVCYFDTHIQNGETNSNSKNNSFEFHLSPLLKNFLNIPRKFENLKAFSLAMLDMPVTSQFLQTPNLTDLPDTDLIMRFRVKQT